MKNFHLPIFLTAMAALFTLSSAAQDVMVSGAGTADANGIYVESGTYNGKAMYVKGEYSIIWECDDECDNWHIMFDNCAPGGCYDPLYVTEASEADTPPSTDWRVSYEGDSPAPSVGPAGPALSYSAPLFRESANNNGTMGASITITHNGFGGDVFTGSNNDDFLAVGKATVTNLPVGLEATLVRSSSTSLTFSLTLAAIDHANVDDISDLTLEFEDAAFTGANATGVSRSVKNDIMVDFIQVLTVASSGADFTTIAAAIAAAAPNDIIELAGETFTESGIHVNKALTIKGQGAAQTIVQANAAYSTATDRVFHTSYNQGALVTISDLTIQHGKMTGGWGAGIRNEGPLRLERCVIQKNIVVGAFNTFGGGVNASGASLTAIDCLFLENVTQATAGGMSKGGAVYHDNSSGYYTNCTFSANSAIGNGSEARDGGAINQYQAGELIVTNCTFTGNTAHSSSGAVFTIFGDDKYFTNTVMYGNIAPAYSDYLQIGGTSHASNCITEQVITFNGTSSNISNADPLLSALADNGGPTMTHAIGLGSPAIDAGLNGVADFDQRGNYRNATRDIGAYEYEAKPAWIGVVNSDWSTAGNWSHGQVPDATTEAIIGSSAPYQPVISNAPLSPATCTDLTVLTGAQLTVAAGGAFTVSGNIANAGTVQVEADATAIGSLITDGAVTGAGVFQIEQYLLGAGGVTPNGVFQYISSPVVGGTSLTYAAAGTNKLWSANEAIQAYTEITTNATALNVGKGYVARMGADGVYTFNGTAFNTGNVSISSLTRTGNTNANRGYNLIGNPYPSSLDWDGSVDTTNLFGTIWYRTHTSGDVMTTDTYNPTSGLGTDNNYMGTDATGIIPPGQAFWVRVRDDNSTTSITFTNAMRLHGSQTSIYKQAEEEGTVRLALSNGAVSDQTIVHFTADATDSFDDFDSHKMWMDNIPQLYTTAGEDSLTINGLLSIETNPIVDLGIKAPAAGDYTITASSITLTEEVWLEDKLLNNFQYLNQNPVYAFATDAGNIGDRFALHFGMMAVGVDGDAINRVSTVFASDGMVNVSVGEDAGAGTITILDMAGRTVQTAAINGSRTVVATDLNTGIYLVRVETPKGAETHRVMLR